MYFNLLLSFGVIISVLWLVSRWRTANERALERATRERLYKLSLRKPVTPRVDKGNEVVWHEQSRNREVFK